MDREIGEKWVEALKSGKYQQGSGALREQHPEEDHESFCCLGVLAHTLDVAWKEQGGGYGKQYLIQGAIKAHDCEFPQHSGYQHGYLPDHILERVGLTHAQQKMFSRMNDDTQMTFREIAEEIEKNWLD